MTAYQYALRALFLALPSGAAPSKVPAVASVGRSEIYAGSDGAVVLFYASATQEVSVKQFPHFGQTVNQILSGPIVCAYYDSGGNRAPPEITVGIQVDKIEDTVLHFADPQVQVGFDICRPKYQGMMILGWLAKLDDPADQAKEDFDFVFAVRNLLGDAALGKTLEELRAAKLEASSALVEEARSLLVSAKTEEELQTFFVAHPELIFPEYVKVYPKFKLADDYVTDFVFLIQGQSGLEYIFVELEKPTKKLFISAGQFSAEYSQAKNQLSNWEVWISKNLAYIQQKLPGLFQPSFHLIMDRSTSLDISAREKIRVETQGTRKIVSTYDDVVDRFESINDRLGR